MQSLRVLSVPAWYSSFLLQSRNMYLVGGELVTVGVNVSMSVCEELVAFPQCAPLLTHVQLGTRQTQVSRGQPPHTWKAIRQHYYHHQSSLFNT